MGKAVVVVVGVEVEVPVARRVRARPDALLLGRLQDGMNRNNSRGPRVLEVYVCYHSVWMLLSHTLLPAYPTTVSIREVRAWTPSDPSKPEDGAVRPVVPPFRFPSRPRDFCGAQLQRVVSPPPSTTEIPPTTCRAARRARSLFTVDSTRHATPRHAIDRGTDSIAIGNQ